MFAEGEYESQYTAAEDDEDPMWVNVEDKALVQGMGKVLRER